PGVPAADRRAPLASVAADRGSSRRPSLRKVLQHRSRCGIQVDMGDALRRRLQQTRFESPYHEAVLNLMVAASHVRAALERVCAEFHVTEGQYNVLRILRGAHPDGYSRCEI